MLILPVSTLSSIFELMSLLRSNYALYSDTMALRTGYEHWDHECTVYLVTGSVLLRTVSSGKASLFAHIQELIALPSKGMISSSWYHMKAQ